MHKICQLIGAYKIFRFIGAYKVCQWEMYTQNLKTAIAHTKEVNYR